MEKVTRLFAKQNLYNVPADRINLVPADKRQKAFDDLHGINEIVEETPELVAEKLEELDREFPSAAQHSGLWSYNSQYVQRLRLGFLRAADFDVQNAASRIRQYFERKWDLFGRQEMMERQVCIHDFRTWFPKDLPALYGGYFQLLSQNDRAGRTIVLINPAMAGCEGADLKIILRIHFFILSLAAENEEAQKRGIVFIYHGFGAKLQNTDSAGFARARILLSVKPSMPINMKACHFCYDDPSFKILLDFLAPVKSSRFLVRFQAHFGTPMECQYNLMSFGIHPEAFPLNRDGSVHCRDHVRLLSSLERIGNEESISDDSSSFSIQEGSKSPPSTFDILLGRGQRGKNWPGNSRLKELLERNFRDYNKASRRGKKVLLQLIYDELKDEGCRFLAMDGGSGTSREWIEVEEKVALDRIGHGFRNLRQSTR